MTETSPFFQPDILALQPKHPLSCCWINCPHSRKQVDMWCHCGRGFHWPCLQEMHECDCLVELRATVTPPTSSLITSQLWSGVSDEWEEDE